MTKEDKAIMEKRLKAAEDASRRCTYLTEAVKKLKSGDCKKIMLCFGDAQYPIQQYAEADGNNARFAGVCWSGDEDGLNLEIRQAVLDILAKRLAEAQKQYEEA